MKQRISCLAALLLIAMTAHAEEAATNQESSPEQTTRDWLELQRSGQVASQQAQPLSGPAMERVHERYLKSFQHPQPMYFKHDETIAR